MMAPRWNHTAHYHEILLKAVPTPCERALEVGCGEGDFARLLSRRVGQVDAVDASPEVIAAAKTFSADFPNLRSMMADFMAHRLEPSAYDFIGVMASLHHLSFAPAIQRMKHLLRPGGVLGIIALWRAHGSIDFARSAVAFSVGCWHRLLRGAASMNAPVAAPTMTWDEISGGVARLLPGAVVQRHLLSRYSLVWTKPAAKP